MMREALTCASVPDQHVYFSELQTMAPLTRVKPQIFSSFFQQSELSRIRPLNNINQVSKRRTEYSRNPHTSAPEREKLSQGAEQQG